MCRAATVVAVVIAGVSSLVVSAQSPPAEARFEAARTASGQDFQRLFALTCGFVQTPPAPPVHAPAAPRATWHADPIKVFDNLYYIGMTEFSAWAVVTSAGIIVLDALYDYAVEDEVVQGLRTLGLDPAQIKYVIVSHAHDDHLAGARFLQARGAQIVMSGPEWDLVERSRFTFEKPTRDVVATDGQRLTLGDTTLTLYVTPGHTIGTISTLIPVKDNGTPHTAALWGGTAFDFIRAKAEYITPERPPLFWFKAYAESAERFRAVADQAGADVILSNHTSIDGTKIKIPALATRAAGAPHPYVIGQPAVRRFMSVASECARAGEALSTTASR